MMNRGQAKIRDKAPELSDSRILSEVMARDLVQQGYLRKYRQFQWSRWPVLALVVAFLGQCLYMRGQAATEPLVIAVLLTGGALIASILFLVRCWLHQRQAARWLGVNSAALEALRRGQVG